MRKICLTVMVALLFSQSAYAAVDKSPFKITLVIPEKKIFLPIPGTKPFLNREPDFHVLLQDISDKPQYIWDEHWSPGYRNLSFEMIMDNKRISIEKPEVSWRRNTPYTVIIEPGEYKIFNVYVSSYTWNFPKPEGVPKPKIVKLKAIYRNESRNEHFLFSSDIAKGKNIWAGQTESDPLDVTVMWK